METVTVPQISEQLQKVPRDKLIVVYEFISQLLDQRHEHIIREPASEAYQTMLASEAVLRRDWDRPEEDEAWADL